jgi:hypothetical protein
MNMKTTLLDKLRREEMKPYGKPIMAFIVVLLTLIPGAYGTLSVAGGSTVILSGDSSVQGTLAADNNGATFVASSSSIISDFENHHQLDFGKYAIDSNVAIKGGSIGVCSEITKPTVLGGETSLDLIAVGSSVDVALSGVRGSNAAGQKAGVGNGILLSTLNLVADDGLSTYQNTAIRGDAAVVESSAFSEKNYMAAKGGYSGGDVDLNTQIISASNDRAFVDGRASVAGIQCLNEEDLRDIANAESDGEGVSTNGLVLDKEENLVDFGFNVMNVNARPENEQSDGASTSEYAQFGASAGFMPLLLTPVGPSRFESTVAGGDPKNYVLFKEISNMRNPGSWPDNLYPSWRIDKPMQFSLQVDNNLRSTGLNPLAVLFAANTAQQTWDQWTSKQLFKGTTPSTQSLVDVNDGKNVIGFLGGDDPGVAFARTYTRLSGNAWFVTESDISFSQRILPGALGPDWGGWTTDYSTANNRNNQKLDFQTVLLHELGHTSGLGDLYLLPAGDPRHSNREIMNGGDLWADHIAQHNLGKGDITGLRKIYGDAPIWN